MIIGEVSEDYVLAAGEDAARPQFPWKIWAVCAACAALIVAASPAYRGLSQKASTDSVSALEDAPEASQGSDDALIQGPGLHEYTLVEGGVTAITTQGNAKVPEDSGSAAPGHGAPVPEPAQPPRGDGPSDTSGGTYMDGTDGDTPIGIPAQNEAAARDEASAQYERLLQSLGLWGIDGRGLYPDWCGGIWLDGEYLTVAIVNGFRTPGLEKQILDWCGGTGEVLFTGAIYSQNYLDNLMKEIDRVFEELDCHIFLSYGVYVMDNRIHLDFFEVPGDEVLAALAELDPDGSAIYIQVFTGVRNIPTDGSAKGPAPVEPAVEPAAGGAQAEPSAEAEPTPVPADDSAAAAEPSVPPAP